MPTRENQALPDEVKSQPEVKLTDQQVENLRTAYRELCTSYRAIDDFRAKLLGFLPLATGTGIFLLLDKLKDMDKLAPETNSLLAAVGAFGFSITLGLFLYEVYGIKKCGALIKAGQHIEESLHMNNGQFSERPQNVARLINEVFAAGVIYPVVLAAWTYFAMNFAWPEANPLVPILVFIKGFACTIIYDFILRRSGKEPA